MSYAIRILAQALKGIEALPVKLQIRLRARIDALAENPRPSGSTKLAGYSDYYRIRVGDYRVVYQIDDAGQVVIVLIAAHRSNVYRGL